MKTGWPPHMLQDDCRELSKWLSNRIDSRRHAREAAEAYSKLRESDSKVSERYSESSEKMAEWTGLEPATPGVTGRGMKSMLARVSALFDIPKSTDDRDNLPLTQNRHSKETRLAVTPERTDQ